MLISTLVIVPRPDHAKPVISKKPGPGKCCPPEGRVISDFASIIKLNCRASPVARRSVYLEVSSFVMYG